MKVILYGSALLGIGFGLLYLTTGITPLSLMKIFRAPNPKLKEEFKDLLE